MGIGADDIFVFVDAFKQASLQEPHISGSLVTRFAWAYNRAASAMLATSLTTFVAFSACGFSPIWDIRCFGIVNGVMVLADYLLVITWLPAAVVIHERYISPWDTGLWCTIVAKKLCSPRVGCLMGRDAPKTSPRVVDEEPEGENSVEAAATRVVAVKPMNDIAESDLGESVSAAPPRDNEVRPQPKQRAIEAFFEGPYFHFVVKYKLALIGCIALLFVVSGIIAGIMLRPDTESVDLFGKDHFYTRALNYEQNKFAFTSGTDLHCYLVYGLEESNAWDLGDLEPAADIWGKGNPHFSGFDLYNYQSAFSTACEVFHQQLDAKGYSGSNSYECWIDDFDRWLDRNDYAFPVTGAETFLTRVDEWYSATDGWYNASDGGSNYEYFSGTGYLSNSDKVYATFASFKTTLNVETDLGFESMWNFYDAAQDALDAAEKASGLSGGLQVTYFYAWMASGQTYLTSALENVGISLGLGFFVILAMTGNYIVTLIAMGCLLCVIFDVFMLMSISGWKINVLESIDITIASGMAVDCKLPIP